MGLMGSRGAAFVRGWFLDSGPKEQGWKIILVQSELRKSLVQALDSRVM